MNAENDTDGFNIHPTLVQRDPHTLKLLDVNARFMRKEQYDTLVSNVRRDGALTSVPLVWRDPDTGVEEVLSGNHRTMAARDAELSEITVMLIDQPLSQAQRTAIQLSHNAIAGEDDPGTLRVLYESISDVDLQMYSGLDDKTLDLLEETQVESLSEANLEYASVQLTFLPHELEAAHEALEAAREDAPGVETWVALMKQYKPFLNAMETAHTSMNIISTAGALAVIMSVFDEHLDDLREGWADENCEPKFNTGRQVPMETVMKTRLVSPKVGSQVLRAVKWAEDHHELGEDGAWGFLAELCDEFMQSKTGDK